MGNCQWVPALPFRSSCSVNRSIPFTSIMKRSAVVATIRVALRGKWVAHATWRFALDLVQSAILAINVTCLVSKTLQMNNVARDLKIS